MNARYEAQQVENQAALDTPQVGDYWHEMFSPYFIIVAIEGEQFTVLSAMGGGRTSDRKYELNAKFSEEGGFCFDISKAMIVDKKWIAEAVLYNRSVSSFIADVVRRTEKDSYCSDYEEFKSNYTIPKHVNALKLEYERISTTCKITDSDRLMFVLQNGLPVEQDNNTYAYKDMQSGETKIQAIDNVIIARR
jgi:hypothetical protein